jgi:hypothetical protein
LTATVTSTSSRVRTAGQLCIAGAVLGAVGGLVMAFMQPAVGPDRFSYPFTPTGHRIAEASLAVNHLLLLIGVLGIEWAAASGRGRLGRAGVGVTVVGLTALTLCEVGAILLADSACPTPRTDHLGIGYGLSSILIGLGLVMAGVAAVRACRWAGWARPDGVLIVARQNHDTAMQYAADQLAWRAHRDGHGQPLPNFPNWIHSLQRMDPRIVCFAHPHSVWMP